MRPLVPRSKCRWVLLAAQADHGQWQPPSLRGLRPRTQCMSIGRSRPLIRVRELQRKRFRQEQEIGRYAWSLLDGAPDVFRSLLDEGPNVFRSLLGKVPNAGMDQFWRFLQVQEVKITDMKGGKPLVILLLTQSCIKLLDDNYRFVPNLLSSLFPAIEATPRVDVLAAVVDGISYPPDCFPVPNVDKSRTSLCGFEGISVAVTDSNTAAPDLWSESNLQKAKGPKSDLERSLLSFRFSTKESELYSATAPQKVQSRISRVVQLPVANTLFTNGQPSTMFAASWVMKGGPFSRSEYVCVKKVDLAQQVLDLSKMFKNEEMRHQSRLILELQPMTAPRVIATGLGNIIRELHKSTNSNETMPASQELENAIARQMESMEGQGGKLGVWALITPRTNWVDGPQIGNSNAAHWIERGSRLHRVLSGGGGWGAKQGLVALDPETHFHSPGSERHHAAGNDDITNDEPGRALKGLFKPGDIITFFRSNFLRKKTLAPKLEGGTRHWHAKSSPSVCFGSGTSVGDTNSYRIEGNENFARMLVKGHFGMISDQGITFHARRECSASSLEPTGTIVHTKIDCPLAYFHIKGRLRSEFNMTDEKGMRPTRRMGSSFLNDQASSDEEAKRPTRRMGLSLLNDQASSDEGMRPTRRMGSSFLNDQASSDEEGKRPTRRMGSSFLNDQASSDEEGMRPTHRMGSSFLHDQGSLDGGSKQTIIIRGGRRRRRR